MIASDPARQEFAAALRTRMALAVFAAIVLGALARLALLAFPAHGFDSWVYQHWTWRLVHEPIGRFYVNDGQALPDHLPGDMWLLKLLAELARFVHPDIDFYSSGYTAIIAAMVTGFDAVLAVVLWRLGLSRGRQKEGVVAGLAYWCMPAPILVASVWGQTDGIGAAISVGALVLAVHGRYFRAFVVLAFCVMVKPQYALLALPLLAGWWHADRCEISRWIRDVAVTATVCLAMIAAIVAPFDMSIAGGWGRWNLIDRLRSSADLYPVSALGAHNLWGALDPLWLPPDDRVAWLLGLSRQSVGLVLFVGIVVLVGWAMMNRWQGDTTLVLTSNVLMFGFFLVSTRMHERYLFPVLGMSLLLALLDARHWRYAIAVNTLVFANVALRFVWPLNDAWTGLKYMAGLGWLEHVIVVRLLVIATVILFVYLCSQLFAEPSAKTPLT